MSTHIVKFNKGQAAFITKNQFTAIDFNKKVHGEYTRNERKEEALYAGKEE